MLQSEEQVIEIGDKVSLRKLMSIKPNSGSLPERMYESDVLRVYNAEMFKLLLPKEYGDTVTLPIDMVYEIVIRTEDDVYRAKGRIMERFRDADGDVCTFRLTTALSRDAKKRYLSCDCKIPVRYRETGGKETGHGVLTRLTLDFAVMESPQYTSDGSELNMAFTPDGGREMTVNARVSETIKLRSGDYESRMQLDCGNVRLQSELARWILRQNSE